MSDQLPGEDNQQNDETRQLPDEDRLTAPVQRQSQEKRDAKQRETRNLNLEKRLLNKRFVDIRQLNLNIPENSGDGFTHRQYKVIESQITSFFESNRLLTIPTGDLDGYVGFLVGKYPQLYDKRYHGYVSSYLSFNLKRLANWSFHCVETHQRRYSKSNEIFER